MTEKEILEFIRKDTWMMEILRKAEELNLPDWCIGAGFVRNKVWDHLHGIDKEGVDTNDIDLVYFDPAGNDEKADDMLSEKLKKETGIPWEVKNETYMHRKNNLSPYKSCEDALSQWPETATGIGIKLENGKLRLIAPHGIDDLVNMVVRKSPKFSGGDDVVKDRMVKKGWLDRWPKLKVAF